MTSTQRLSDDFIQKTLLADTVRSNTHWPRPLIVTYLRFSRGWMRTLLVK